MLALVSAAPAGQTSYAVEVWQHGVAAGEIDVVAEETPVALIYNGRAHAVMLATPRDLEDFALGFSLSEGIVETAAEIGGIEIVNSALGVEIYLSVPAGRAAALQERNRHLAGTTACGLCGAETLQQAIRQPTPVAGGSAITVRALHAAFEQLPARQPINQATGSVHGAAWVDRTGAILIVREDVGRHNALDKLIGALASTHTDLRQGFVALTSRASFEMVQKVASAGITLVAAISAPTGLAIRLAQESGVTLIARVRAQRHVIYTHPQRVVAAQP